MPVYDICDFSKVDNIGVVCRGKSLGSVGKFKDKFKNCFIVGQHLESFKKIGEHFKGSNIVKVHGSIFTKYKKHNASMDAKYNIKDMQTYLIPEKSDRKAYKFKKICKKNKWLKVHSQPVDFIERNKRFSSKRVLGDGKITHPTLGTFGVDLAAAYKPKDVYIIGLDFYSTQDFVIERMHISQMTNKPKMMGMIEYLNLLCDEEKDINFHLYTCCDKIKSKNNLEVVRV